MSTTIARGLACGLVVLAFTRARPLHAQLEIGTWVRRPTASMPAMTMEIGVCCNGGRRLTYHIDMEKKQILLTVDTQLDGKEAAVLMDGKPSGETMAIKRVDAHNASTVVKLNGTFFGTAKGTLSADGKTLTVLDDFTSSVGGYPAGKFTEVWDKK